MAKKPNLSNEGRAQGSDEWLHGEDVEDEDMDDALRAVLDREGALASDVTTTTAVAKSLTDQVMGRLDVALRKGEDHKWVLRLEPKGQPVATVHWRHEDGLLVECENAEFRAAILALGEMDEDAPDGYKEGGKKIADSEEAAGALLTEFADAFGFYISSK